MLEMKGNKLFGERYFLERLLGRGNFSEVWLAKDTRTDIEVALKIYAPATGLDDHGLDVLSREFAIVVNANHKNLLKPLYYEVYERKPYLVLPFCEKGSIQSEIGKMSETDCWRMLRDVAAGLHHLHHMTPTIIHQDIKPDNIMNGPTGDYMITDFGVSTHARSTLRKSMSEAFQSAGTWAYMGPERFSRENMPIMASDIWSLGATAYEMMAGDVPFGNEGGMLQKSGAEIPVLHGVSADLSRVIEACLAKDSWDRPTAGQLVEMAEDGLNGNKVYLPGESRPNPNKKRNIVIASVVSVLLIVAIVATILYLNAPEPVDPFAGMTPVEQCVALMKDPQTAKDGFKRLNEESQKGNSECTFLLSRIYFKSLSPRDLVSAEVGEITNCLNIKSDNKKAHDLLLKAVKQDKNNYKALYELGCDFLGGDSRTEAVERDIKTADSYFRNAMKLAKKAKDQFYIDKIQGEIDVYKDYLEAVAE